jgi:hypothetical protein
MRKVVESYDDLQDEIKDWDSTLMDGLEDEEPMVYEPSVQDEDWKIVDEEQEIVQSTPPPQPTVVPRQPLPIYKTKTQESSKRYF